MYSRGCSPEGIHTTARRVQTQYTLGIHYTADLSNGSHNSISRAYQAGSWLDKSNFKEFSRHFLLAGTGAAGSCMHSLALAEWCYVF